MEGTRGSRARHATALGLRRVIASTAVAALVGVGGAFGQPAGECGDCDGDGAVGISELILAVNIALGRGTLAQCSAADVDETGDVSIGDLIRAVNRAATGTCGGSTTATVAATPTATPSPVPRLDGPDLIQGASEIALQNISSFQVFDFGTVGAVQPNRSAFRLAAHPRRAAAVLRPLAARGGVAPLCDEGSAEPTCTGDTLTVVYDDCRTATASGGSLVRSGRWVQAVSNPARTPVICQTGEIRAEEDTVELRLEDFRQTETDAGGSPLAQLTATVTERFVPARTGCVGAEEATTIDGTQTLDGSLSIRCAAAATSVNCPPGGTDRVLRPHQLTLARSSGGFPCEIGLTASGELAVEDLGSGAVFTQSFDGFLLTETTRDDVSGTSLFTQIGRLSVDCLGALTYDTKVTESGGSSTGAITFPPEAACPVDGLLEVRRPLERVGGAFLTRTAALDVGDETSHGVAGQGPVDMAFRDRLFRAQNGAVYQVLQNAGANVGFGADGIQITSLVGTAAGPLSACARIANATVDPQAVIATDENFAFPPERVFKSGLIEDATLPCFSRTFDGGRGIVCIGPECTVDCTCAEGRQCAAYSIGGTPITESPDGDPIPAATLMTSIPPLEEGSPCVGLGGRETYRFGASGPTTETRQCSPAPADGFVLRSTPSRFPDGDAGTTVVFAYDAPLASLFNAGSAGFAIDEDGDSQICGGQPGVLHIGQAEGLSIEAPQIQYTASGGVRFDFDGDRAVDRTVGNCAVSALLRCQ